MLKATNRKLTGSEKRQIKAVIRRARSGHGNRVSAQQTIPYQRMYPDGVCRVDVNRYNKTIQFQDINYQLSENEDKDAIFGSWCEFKTAIGTISEGTAGLLRLSSRNQTAKIGRAHV